MPIQLPIEIVDTEQQPDPPPVGHIERGPSIEQEVANNVAAQMTNPNLPPLTAEVLQTTVEDKDGKKPKTPPPPSFEGTIIVKFPDTEESWEFQPVEVIKSQTGVLWKYPSPVPKATTEQPKEEDRLQLYTKLLGVSNTLDTIESALNELCQAKWKQAKSDSSIFATIFHEGKQREAISYQGLMKKAQEYMGLFKKAKDAAGGKITEEAKEYHRLYKEFTDKANAAMMAEMAKMDAEINAANEQQQTQE